MLLSNQMQYLKMFKTFAIVLNIINEVFLLSLINPFKTKYNQGLNFLFDK